MLTTSGFNSCGLYFSNAHGHYDVAVMILRAVAHGTHFTGAFLVLQLEGYLLLIVARRKSSRYWALKPISMSGPPYSLGTLSSLSPVSTEDEKIFTSPAVNCTRMARERSSANCETRSIAERISSRFSFAWCTLSLGRTLS